MPNDENTHRNKLPKLIDNGTTNNYGEWKMKSYYKLRNWDLLKYIEGPESTPLFIPPLCHLTKVHGLDENNTITTVRVLGNEDEHRQAIADAQPWMAGNNNVLAHIVASLPTTQLHLALHVQYAKELWDNLRSIYQPQNSLHAITIKGQIMTYRCTADMNVARWLNNMQHLYNSLCDLELERMSDREFALTILDLMPLDGGWRDFVSNLRIKVCDSDALRLPIVSSNFITTIRDEYWYHNRDNHQATAHIFSARHEAQKWSTAQKRGRPADFIASSSALQPDTKRPRNGNPSKAHLRCTNTHCGSKIGHDAADCISYTGAKQGQYGDWWRGPWNIHLPESLRTKENNIPPRNHPVFAR